LDNLWGNINERKNLIKSHKPMAHHPERIKTFYMLNLKRINLRRRIGRWREMPEGKVKLIGWKLGILGQKRKNSSTDAEGNIQEYSTDNGKEKRREGKLIANLAVFEGVGRRN
jgi:hypothetical protein